MAEQQTSTTGSWERNIIEKMVFESIKEQKRSRRWRIFFRLIFLAILAYIIYLLVDGATTVIKPHSGVIHIDGTIGSDSKASAKNIISGLHDAFDDKTTKGVILSINSPGGSPVQANQVFDEIIRLREKHPDVKVYAVCKDLCASGAYYIAAAADEIYANQASIVGSIGVVTEGFGFVDTLQKLGMQRRLFTSGSNKGFMDPFSPIKDGDAQRLQVMLDIIHQQFIKAVEKGRGSRLKSDPELFSGIVWTGEQALALGLIDGFATSDQVAKNIIKEDTIVDYTTHNDIFQRLTDNFTTKFTQSIGLMLGITPAGLR